MIKHFFGFFFLLYSAFSFSQGNITTLNSNTREHFRSVFFVDAKIGYIAGNNGTILQTIDGGKSWITRSTDYKEFLYDITFQGKKTGFIVGGNFENEAVIMKSENYGENWSITHRYQGISAFMATQAVNEKVVYVSGYNGAILKTTNSGTSWAFQKSGVKERLQGLSFVNELTGWIVGTQGTIIHTKDGGKTWNTQQSGTNEHLESIHFLNENIGYTTGNNGIILATKDGGKTWIKQESFTTEPLHAVRFINANVGYAVGGYLCNGKIPTIVYTNNGGETWRSNNSPVLIPLNGIFFNTSQQGFIVGLQGTLLRIDLKLEAEKLQTMRKNEVSNFPNPFTDVTSIRFFLEETSDVELKIYNMIGEEIFVLKNPSMEKGPNQITWDGNLKNGKHAPTGLYFYKLKIKSDKEERVETRRMVMVK
jgi:photosystem II stability/assembly factor-like uncharacterized protein